MSNNLVLLVYNVENLNAATPLGIALQNADLKVEYHGLSPDTIGKETYSQISSRTEPVILLISDNFLKSEAGMDQALATVQDLHRRNRLIPVITDGVYHNERTGLVNTVPTTFERVSNVIQYMNFWQDRYLELRKVKKDAGSVEEDNHNEQIKSVRAISTEIGELLRFLRSIDCYHYDDLSMNHFADLLQLINHDNPEIAPGSGSNNGYVPAYNNAEPVQPEDTQAEPDYAIYESHINYSDDIPDPEPEKITVVTTHLEPVSVSDDDSDDPKFDEIVEIKNAVVATDFPENEELESPQPEMKATPEQPQVSIPLAETSTARNIKTAYIETLLEEAEDNKKSNAAGFRNQLNDLVDEVVAEEKGIDIGDDDFSETDLEKDPELASLFNDNKEKPEARVTMEDVFIMPQPKAPEPPMETAPQFSAFQDNEPIEAVTNILEDDDDDDEEEDIDEMHPEMEQEGEIDEEAIKKQVSFFLETPETLDEEIPAVPESANTFIQNTVIPEATETEVLVPEPDTSAPVSIIEPPADPVEEEITAIPAIPVSITANPVEEEPESSTSEEQDKDAIATALELYANGSKDAGKAAFENILAENPDSIAARISYARCLAFQEHHLSSAIRELEKVLYIDDKHIPAYILLGELAELHKDFLLAQNYYTKVIDIDPETPGIYYKLGLLTNNHFKGQRKKAAKYFKKAFELDPGNSDAGFQYANILLEHFGKAKKAARYYQDIVRVHPDNDQAWLALADIFYENADQAKANECYLKAIGINTSIQTNELDEKYHFTPPVVEEEIVAEAIPEAPVYPVDNGLTVLITGATSGIGLATAQLLASQGFRLILTGRRKDRLELLEQQIREQFQTKTQCLHFDVRNIADAQKAIESLDENWEQVDILINNAGLASGLEYIHEGHIEDWETMIDTNIKGLLYMTRAITPGMVARKKGHIINISSAAAIDAYPKGNVYCATKAAVDMLTKSIRLDLYQHGIRVSQVSPGHVEETEFAKVRFHGDQDKANIYSDFQPLKSKDVAEAIWFMISRPEYVNINDIVMTCTQQANTVFIDRSGRNAANDGE